MISDDDYEDWLKRRRSVTSNVDLADKVMAAIGTASPAKPATALQRVGPWMIWTAASLVFVAKVAALVGNLVFPTDSYPEFAADHRIEDVPHDHRIPERS